MESPQSQESGAAPTQEIGFTLVAELAFLLIAPIGALLQGIISCHTAEGIIASNLFGIAACLLVAGQLVQIGTQWAVLSFSKREFSKVETLGFIWDTGLVVSNWLENGRYFSLALGVIGWAMVGRGLEPQPRVWIFLSGFLSIALLIIVIVAQALEIWTIYDIALPLSGAVLAPTWLLLTARVCESVGSKFNL